MIKVSTLENFSAKLIYALPIFIIIGNFFADLTIVLINIIFMILIFKTKSLDLIYKNKYFWVLFFFYLYVLIRSIFTLEWISIKSALFLFRFPIFIFAFYYLYINKILNLRILYFIFIFILFILLIDGTYQYIFKQNILGIKILHENRVSSFFGDELIMGSFTFRLLSLIIPLTILMNQDKLKISLYLKLILFSLSLIFLTILSGERLAFFLFLLYLIIIFLILPKSIFSTILNIFIIILVTIFIFKSDNNFSKRIINTTKINIENYVFKKNEERKNILSLSKMHDDHYSSGIKMFQDNFIFGQGIKMFRIKCKEPKFETGKYSCSTHPHNILIQFLSELGIVGTLFLLYFYFSIFIKIRRVKNKSLIVSSTFLVFLIFFPFLPYGNFFHNGLVITNIFSISFLWCLYYRDNK